MELINDDCLEELKKLKDKSIDFFYLDLPYGQTACKWDKKLDHKALWVQLKRLAKNERTPFFFSCTTKFGFELYNTAPKGWFRWDLVWKKNRAAGFLNAYKLPMRKHEMIYCFAKKSPEYDVSSHKEYKNLTQNYSDENRTYKHSNKKRLNEKKLFKVPLPTSDITPPSEEHELVYCFAKKCPEYDVSSHKEYEESSLKNSATECYGNDKSYILKSKTHKERLPDSDITPSSWCEFKNDERINHRTAKPVKLMEFLLKYWTKEGDTICDPTAGSGSMGVACKNMNRKFIGIEKDKEIYDLMCDRIKKTPNPKND